MASYTQLLQRQLAGKLNADGELYVQQVLEGATRMRALINALLDYSSVGRRALAIRPVDLAAVFDIAMQDLAATIAESHAQVTRGPLPSLPADPVQLGQLFRNLVANAIRFRGEAPPMVDVQARRVEDHWQITVRDNGIGIESKHFERIFVIFQRLHGRERAGTGIGLAVCKKIIDRHGGRIWVESEPGKGSTFHFTLPAGPQPDSPG
jgi:light-regulated signal transduction histidine kinase (bacteriophytochrome)